MTIYKEECTKTYKHILERLDKQDEIINEYEKYSQLYYSLCCDVLNRNITEGQKITKQEIVLPSEYPKIWERIICEKCPWIIPFLIILHIILLGIDAKELGTGLVEFGQEAIVRIEGKQDIFFVESDSATVYSEPSVHADIIGEVYYSDKVKRISDINMWDNIFYYDENGDLIIGWIASKKLISYQEWKFNSDKLYEISNE